MLAIAFPSFLPHPLLLSPSLPSALPSTLSVYLSLSPVRIILQERLASVNTASKSAHVSLLHQVSLSCQVAVQHSMQYADQSVVAGSSSVVGCLLCQYIICSMPVHNCSYVSALHALMV